MGRSVLFEMAIGFLRGLVLRKHVVLCVKTHNTDIAWVSWLGLFTYHTGNFESHCGSVITPQSGGMEWNGYDVKEKHKFRSMVICNTSK